MSLVLGHDTDKAEKHVYFVSKVFRGAKARYQNIEKLALVVIFRESKSHPYISVAQDLCEN